MFTGRSLLCSYRFLIAIIAFFAYAAQYTQKINMSVAIVCMVNNTALKLQDPKLNFSSVEIIENQTQSSECGGYESSANKTSLVINFAQHLKITFVIIKFYYKRMDLFCGLKSSKVPYYPRIFLDT